MVTFSWTSRPGGEPPYGEVQQGAARQGRGPVHQIRALRRRGGFLGRVKQEFLRKRGFAGVSMDGFIGMLDGYMVWYRNRRIKTKFGMSIMARRGALGLAA